LACSALKFEFATDSPLEEAGFEPSVPGRETVKPPRGDEAFDAYAELAAFFDGFMV
jgi:hypothetical protein